MPPSGSRACTSSSRRPEKLAPRRLHRPCLRSPPEKAVAVPKNATNDDRPARAGGSRRPVVAAGEAGGEFCHARLDRVDDSAYPAGALDVGMNDQPQLVELHRNRGQDPLQLRIRVREAAGQRTDAESNLHGLQERQGAVGAQDDAPVVHGLASKLPPGTPLPDAHGEGHDVVPGKSAAARRPATRRHVVRGPCINAGAMKRILYRALMSLFVPAGTAALAQTSALSVEEARTIVAPLLRGAQRTGEERCREAPREGHQSGIFDGETQLFPGLRSIPGYGHTPGQSYYVLAGC